MTFPTIHTVGHHVWTPGVEEDAHGNLVDGWVPPLDEDGTEVRVIGWSVPSSTEPALAGHDRVVVDIELLVPPGVPFKPRDVVDLPGLNAGQFEIVGEIRDYTSGPFGWSPGGVVNLSRVEG